MATYRLSLLVATFLLMASTTAVSRTVMSQDDLSSASLASNGLIQLPTDRPLSDSYQIDFGSLNLASSDAADAYFQELYAGIVRFEVDFESNSAVLFLEPATFDAKSMNWGVAEWNDYFTKTHQTVNTN